MEKELWKRVTVLEGIQCEKEKDKTVSFVIFEFTN